MQIGGRLFRDYSDVDHIAFIRPGRVPFLFSDIGAGEIFAVGDGKRAIRLLSEDVTLAYRHKGRGDLFDLSCNGENRIIMPNSLLDFFGGSPVLLIYTRAGERYLCAYDEETVRILDGDDEHDPE